MKKLILVLLSLALLLQPMMGLAEDASADWQNILLLGCDTKTSEGYDRSDTIIVVSVNAKTNQIKMTSLMRDIWVHIQGYGEQKLNAATVFGGPDLAISTSNKNFGLDIEKYAMINISGMIDLVNALGGIDVEIDQEELEYINNNVEEHTRYVGSDADLGEPIAAPGLVHLNGAQAVCHARNRTTGQGDYSRTERQRNVLMAIANKVKNESSLLTVLAVIKELLGFVETNLSLDDLMALAAVGFNADLSSVEQLRLPVDGTYKTGYVGEYWCIQPNFEQNAKLLHDFIYGE